MLPRAKERQNSKAGTLFKVQLIRPGHSPPFGLGGVEITCTEVFLWLARYWERGWEDVDVFVLATLGD